MKQILEKIAKEFNMTADELRETLQAALDAAFDTPLSPQAERVFHALYRDTRAPTPEAFFAAYFEALRREKEAASSAMNKNKAAPHHNSALDG